MHRYPWGLSLELCMLGKPPTNRAILPAADEIVFTPTVCGVCLVLLLSGLFPLVGFEPFQWRGGDSKPRECLEWYPQGR